MGEERPANVRSDKMSTDRGGMNDNVEGGQVKQQMEVGENEDNQPSKVVCAAAVKNNNLYV